MPEPTAEQVAKVLLDTELDGVVFPGWRGHALRVLTTALTTFAQARERAVVDEFVASCEVAESPEIEGHILGMAEQFRLRAIGKE